MTQGKFSFDGSLGSHLTSIGRIRQNGKSANKCEIVSLIHGDTKKRRIAAFLVERRENHFSKPQSFKIAQNRQNFRLSHENAFAQTQ